MDLISAVMAVVFAAAYLCSLLNVIVWGIHRAFRCWHCRHKYPGCRIETSITSASECPADRYLSAEYYVVLMQKISELD